MNKLLNLTFTCNIFSHLYLYRLRQSIEVIILLFSSVIYFRVTIYIEFLPLKYRAKAIVFLEVFWGIGSCFALLVAIPVMPTLGWRYQLIICSMPLLIFTLLCYWLPESPHYYIASGQKDKAISTIECVAKINRRPMPLGELVSSKFAEKRGCFGDLFDSKQRRTTFLLFIIWFVCAFAYYGIVLATTEIYKSIAESGGQCVSHYQGEVSERSCAAKCALLTTSDYLDTLFTSFSEFPGLLLTVVFIDLIGRRWTMFGGFFLFFVFSLLFLICMPKALITVCIFIVRALISGVFQAVFVYTPEVYPTAVRAIGLGTCSGLARVGALLTPLVAQVLLKISINSAVLVYAFTALIAAFSAILLPIETKGRSIDS